MVFYNPFVKSSFVILSFVSLLLYFLFLTFAQLEKEAVIIGVGTRLEIWNKQNWEKCDENISVDEIAENMTMLGI